MDILLNNNLFKNFPDAHGFSIISFSQMGQDKIVEAILRRCGIKNPSYLDIGCNSPIEISNTALFYRGGSSGVIVDASGAHKEHWDELRPNDIFVNVAVVPEAMDEVEFYMIDEFSGRNSASLDTINKFISETKTEEVEFNIQKSIVVKAMTINEIVEKFCHGEFPDYLSLDIEGFDLEVLKSADFTKSSPKVITIEYATMPGCAVLKEKGFTPILCIGDIVAVNNDYISFVAPWLNVNCT